MLLRDGHEGPHDLPVAFGAVQDQPSGFQVSYRRRWRRRAVYGNSGMSFGQPHWSEADDDQTCDPQSVHKMFGADARETQLSVPRKSFGLGGGVTERRRSPHWTVRDELSRTA
jgi:hypothetical protein